MCNGQATMRIPRQWRVGLAAGAAGRDAVAAGFAVGVGCLGSVTTALASVAAGFGAPGFGATGTACFTAGFGSAGIGVGVGGTPASVFESRTTASSVGSGVGWLSASMSAFCERGAPPPHAAHTIDRTISKTARTRVQLRIRGLQPS
jgi:hypothetical protein